MQETAFPGSPLKTTRLLLLITFPFPVLFLNNDYIPTALLTLIYSQNLKSHSLCNFASTIPEWRVQRATL